MSSAQPIRINGVEYPSRKAAAEALGVAPITISRARRDGRLENFGLSYKKIDTRAFLRMFEEGATNGELAEALGISKASVARRLTYNGLVRERGSRGSSSRPRKGVLA